MLIDCHQHTGFHGRKTPDVIEYLDKAGVDKAWLLSWESIDGSREPSYAHLAISSVFDSAAAYPGRFVIGAGVDPRRERAAALLREYHKEGARVYGELKFRIMMDTPEFILMLRIAGELGMPALFHLELPRMTADGVRCWYLGDADAVDRTLAKCPDTNFVAHGPGWWANISGDMGAPGSYPKGPVAPGGQVIRLLEKYPNLYCDLSANSGYNGITRDPEFGKKFLVDYANRILYGVDFYDTRMLEYLHGLGLPAQVLEKILCSNAMKLIRN